MVPALLGTSLVFVIRSASFPKKKKDLVVVEPRIPSGDLVRSAPETLARSTSRDPEWNPLTKPLKLEKGWRIDGPTEGPSHWLPPTIQGDAKLSAPERDYRLVKVSRVPLIDCA